MRRPTVGGWLAENGVGIGSYEYGWLLQNVISVEAVGAGGERSVIEGGEALRYFVGSSGTTAFFVRGRGGYNALGTLLGTARIVGREVHRTQRILVIDDDPAVTSLLKRGLSFERFDVEVAAGGEEGLAIARERYPDLVVLDIMMPGMDGLEVLRRLRAADPQLPIIMLTARDTSADEIEGLERGADDYVVKPFTFDILLARIRTLLRRQEAERPPVLRFGDLCLDTGTRQALRGEREIDLTTTEYDLLHQFLEHPRRVLPKDFLMDRVWGYDFGGNTNVLEVYVKQLRQKLEAEGERRLIHTLRGTGYVLREG